MGHGKKLTTLTWTGVMFIFLGTTWMWFGMYVIPQWQENFGLIGILAGMVMVAIALTLDAVSKKAK